MEPWPVNVLIDSSVWIDFLRQAPGEADLEQAIREGRAAICPVIWVELWSGARGRREQAALRELCGLCQSLEVDKETWNRAAELRRAAKQKGLHCPLADVLIVACAKRHGVELMHRDKHLRDLLALAHSSEPKQ